MQDLTDSVTRVVNPSLLFLSMNNNNKPPKGGKGGSYNFKGYLKVTAGIKQANDA